MIQEYRFGSIAIDGKTYTYDVEVRSMSSEVEVLDWQRDESHDINIDSVKRAVEQKPDTIIIGTGESGVAKVTESAKQFIAEKGIKLIIDITGEAIKTFNVIKQDSVEEQGEEANIIGLFHLTCQFLKQFAWDKKFSSESYWAHFFTEFALIY